MKTSASVSDSGPKRPRLLRGGFVLTRVGVGLLGLALILSMWASPDRTTSLPWFIIAMCGVILVLVLTSGVRHSLARKVGNGWVICFFVGATVVGLLSALLTSNWQTTKLPWLSHIFAVIPSMRWLPYAWAQKGLSPNQTGGILAVLTAFVAVLATSPAPFAAKGPKWVRPYRAAMVVLCVVSVAVVYMTGSRAALVGLVVAVLMTLLVRSARWSWIWGAGLVVVLFLLAIAGKLSALVHALVRDETLSTKLVARVDIWVSSLKAIQDNPVTGIGLGVFNKVIPVRYPYQTVSLSFQVSQSHNLFLDVAVSIGIPGLIGLLLYFAGIIVMAVRVMSVDLASRLIGLGTLASMTAYVVYGLTDSMSFSRPTSFVIWLWPCALAITQARSLRSGLAAEESASSEEGITPAENAPEEN